MDNINGEAVFNNNTIFLVTGGAGFIGSNLCEYLLSKGYYVRCLDNLSNGLQSNVELFREYGKYSFIEGDICDKETCIKACENVDFVLHQAAWGSVPRSILMPKIYEEINIGGTLNMLEASRCSGVKKFVYASSSSVYGDNKNLPKKEGIEGEVLSPYALTKKVCEEYARLYTKLYGLDTYGLRYFNVFGKRQIPNGDYAAVIPKFIKQIINEERPVIYGDGEQSRDFTYVANVVQANIKACCAKSTDSGKVYNIACGEREKLLDLYYLICKVLEKDIKPVFGPNREGDIKHSHADISRAKRAFGYKPKYNFKEGLMQSINWYINNLDN
jgi:UDP-N-acetylglucosamine 4-epimerase